MIITYQFDTEKESEEVIIFANAMNYHHALNDFSVWLRRRNKDNDSDETEAIWEMFCQLMNEHEVDL